MALENALRGLHLSPQRTGEHGIEENIPPSKIAAQRRA